VCFPCPPLPSLAQSVVAEVAALLRIDEKAIGNALTTKRIKAGSDWITSPVSAEVATNVRDGFAKAMYQRVFSWMVMRVNANLAILSSDDGLSQARFFIGILDIFGFEIFDINSLEQVCGTPSSDPPTRRPIRPQPPYPSYQSPPPSYQSLVCF
jgi:myosin heavy subunit